MDKDKDNKSKETKPKKSAVNVALFVVIAIIVAIGVGALIKNTADISRLKSQNDELEQKYSEQIEENSSLKAILDSEDKDTYMEQKAREEGYIKDNEIKVHDAGQD